MTTLFDTTPPPNGFSTGDLYTMYLRIYAQGGRFWVWDRHGFLCSVSRIEDVQTLLLAESAHHPNKDGRKFYWPTARDLVYPGFAETYEQNMLQNEAAVKAMKAPKFVAGSVQYEMESKSAEELLKDLGL